MARTANNPITYLLCDDRKDQSIQTDCRTTADWHLLTYGNAFTIKSWSHDFSSLVNSYNNPEMFERFIDVVNSQNKYNEEIPVYKACRMKLIVIFYLYHIF